MSRNRQFTIAISISLILVVFPGTLITSQDLDVPYVPTPHEVVAKMLDVTNVGPGDYVIDLGSGDGRIVIAAAERGAIGHGIDLNPKRVEEAKENALKADVTGRVTFLEGDLFKADISNATVITMYLLSSVNLRLRPVLLENLRPGTRIVSHSFSMGEWEADEHINVDNRHIYYWVIPANMRGRWEWTSNGERFTLDAGQEFQKVDLKVNSGNQSLLVQNPVLIGERISFSAINRQNGNLYLFSGRVDGNNITGIAQIKSANSSTVENWSATLRGR